MGKPERKLRRQRQRAAGGGRRPFSPPHHSFDGFQALEMAETVHGETLMPCRVTYMSDPILTGGRDIAPVAGLADDGTPIFDLSDTVDPIPVVLFEPERVLGVVDHRTGTVHEGRTTAIVGSGFGRLTSAPIWNIQPAGGWGVYRTSDGLMLRDRTGAVWAEGHLSLDPRWVSTATNYGSVVVLYGPQLGIRCPDRTTAKSYTLRDKIAEFQEGRRDGVCAVANVRWHPRPCDQTVNWVLLSPGSLDQPLPAAYVPQAGFDALGGPEAFGLAPLGRGARVELPITEQLVAETTPTDVDILQRGLDPTISLVAGYHAADGRSDPEFSSWRRAVNECGAVLVITGHRDLFTKADTSAIGRHAVTGRLHQVLQTSYAAVVVARPAPGRE